MCRNIINHQSVTMLHVLLFSLVTTSSAFTTHRYDSYDSFGNYRPSSRVVDNIFGYDNSNGRRPVQVYEYAKRYDGVVISDVHDGGSDGENRRIDTPFSYENPYQWNRQVPWNTVAVTEPTKSFNRFEGQNEDREYLYNPDTRNGQPIVLKAEKEVVNQIRQTNRLNKTQGNSPLISTQSDDVNRTLVISEQQIAWNNDHQGSSEDNANITTRSVNTDSKTNSLKVSDKPNADKTNRPMKANDRTVISNRDKPNNVENNGNNYRTRATQEPNTKAYEDDRWIWSNGQDQVVETTTLLIVDDRAAFSGDGCPIGKVKFGGICIAKD